MTDIWETVLSEYEEDVLLACAGLTINNSTSPKNQIIRGAAVNVTMEFLSSLGLLTPTTYQLTSKGEVTVTSILEKRGD